MSKMRLTTLNLDDECTEILRKEPNKSRYVRAAIKRYPKVVKELDEMEDTYINIRNAYDSLVRALVDKYGLAGNHQIEDFLGDFCNATPLEVHQAYTAGYLRVAIRDSASRHGNA